MSFGAFGAGGGNITERADGSMQTLEPPELFTDVPATKADGRSRANGTFAGCGGRSSDGNFLIRYADTH